MRRSRHTLTALFGLWALAPFGWLLLEVWAIAWVGRRAGVLLTPLVFLGTSGLGLLLLRGGGLRLALSLTRWGQARRAGEPAGDLPLEDAAPRIAAGLLLLLPGFCTDALGLLVLVPPGSWWVRRQARRLVRAHQGAADQEHFGSRAESGSAEGPITLEAHAVRVREVRRAAPPDLPRDARSLRAPKPPAPESEGRKR